MKVLISGIGIAGPTLAYWLSVGGVESTLVEKSPCLRTGGYALDFWGSGFDIAEKMGIIPEIRRDGYNIKNVELVNSLGRRVGGFKVDPFRNATHGRYVTIARSDLAKAIYRKIQGRSEVIFGDSISGIQPSAGGVDVTFQNARPRHFDAVIGADGLHSIVRKLVFGNRGGFEKFLGYWVAAFESAGYGRRNEDAYITFGAPGKQVGRLTMRNDRTLFLFIFADDGRNEADFPGVEAQKKVLRSQFAGLGWECPEILMAMDSCDDLYFDRVSQIRMDHWSQGRVGLVGDAAFCPSLLAGQGSALAMTSAYVLAGELTKPGALPESAFERYERLLHPLILSKQNAAERFASSFAPRTRLGVFLRNQATKVLTLPIITKRVMRSTLLDRIDLPSYFGDRPSRISTSPGQG